MRNSPARAFTLIELLVVVAVVSLLAAILFPVFGRARENARRSTCQSNLKQIGLGLLQYAQDYDEKMPCQSVDAPGGSYPAATTPYPYSAPAVGTWYSNWLYSVYPYTKSWQVLTCPSMYEWTNSPYGLDASHPDSRTSYWGNGVVMARSVAAIPNTAEVIWAQEDSTRWSTAAFLRPARYDNTVSPQKYGDWLRAFHDTAHFGGGNLLYCDGHVKWKLQGSICAHDFGLKDSTVSGGTACGANNLGATASALF